MPDGHDVMELADDKGWMFPETMFTADDKVILEWSC
jgi:hypothetical protein